MLLPLSIEFVYIYTSCYFFSYNFFMHILSTQNYLCGH